MKNLLYFVLVVLVLAMVSSAFGTPGGGGEKECDKGDVETTYYCHRMWPWSDYCPTYEDHENDVCVSASIWLTQDCTHVTPEAGALRSVTYIYEDKGQSGYTGWVCDVGGTWMKCGSDPCGGVTGDCYLVSESGCYCKNFGDDNDVRFYDREVCKNTP